MTITVVLFALAVINVLTKEVATISGICNRKHKATHEQDLEKFRLDTHTDLSAQSLSIRPGSVLVALRNRHRLHHLDRIPRASGRKISSWRIVFGWR